MLVLVLFLLLLMFLLFLVLFLLLFLLFGFFAAFRSAGRRSSSEKPCSVHPLWLLIPFSRHIPPHPSFAKEKPTEAFGDDSERCKTSPLPNRATETFCKIFPTKPRAFLVVSHQTGKNPHRFSSSFSSFSCFFLEPDVSGLLETLWC